MIWLVFAGVFDMPEERMLSHVKFDVKRKRLVLVTCRREDMVLPKSTFTIYGNYLSTLKTMDLIRHIGFNQYVTALRN